MAPIQHQHKEKQMLTQAEKRRIEELLHAKGKDLKWWYDGQCQGYVDDLGCGELREELYEAMTEGIKKPTKRIMWAEVEGWIENYEEWNNGTGTGRMEAIEKEFGG